MLEKAFRRLFSQGPSQQELALDKTRAYLRRMNYYGLLSEIATGFPKEDPPAILVEHLPIPDPYEISFQKKPRGDILLAVHFDLTRIADIPEIQKTPFLERRNVKTWWVSRAVGIRVRYQGDIEAKIYYSGQDTWNELEANMDFARYALGRQMMVREVPLRDQLKYGVSLAAPVGDFRYGEGYSNFNAKRRNYKYWNVVE